MVLPLLLETRAALQEPVEEHSSNRLTTNRRHQQSQKTLAHPTYGCTFESKRRKKTDQLICQLRKQIISTICISNGSIYKNICCISFQTLRNSASLITLSK